MPHVQLSVHTWNQLRMIMNEKLLNTQTNSQGGFKGINSVMGFKKQTNMENTNRSTLYPPFQDFSTQKSDATFNKVRECFCVFFRAGWETGIGAEARRRPFYGFQLQKASFVTQWETTTSHHLQVAFHPKISQRLVKQDEWLVSCGKPLWLAD